MRSIREAHKRLKCAAAGPLGWEKIRPRIKHFIVTTERREILHVKHIRRTQMGREFDPIGVFIDAFQDF